MKFQKITSRKNKKIIALAFYIIIFIFSILWLDEIEELNEFKRADFNFDNEDSLPIDPTDQVETALVTKVIDGDTIKLNNGQTLRYIGIDAPETHHPHKPKGCFGDEATAKNRELVLGKTVTLIKDVKNTDRYGRLLRYVYVQDLFINEELVRQGYAFAVSYPPDIAKQGQLKNAQKFARENEKGLWNKNNCRNEN